MARGLADFAKGGGYMAIADMDAVLQSDLDHAAAYMLRGILFGNRQQLPPQRQRADAQGSVK